MISSLDLAQRSMWVGWSLHLDVLVRSAVRPTLRRAKRRQDSLSDTYWESDKLDVALVVRGFEIVICQCEWSLHWNSFTSFAWPPKLYTTVDCCQLIYDILTGFVGWTPCTAFSSKIRRSVVTDLLSPCLHDNDPLCVANYPCTPVRQLIRRRKPHLRDSQLS